MTDEVPRKETIKKIANDEITARFQRIGIWEQTPEEIEITRANNVLLNDIRKTRERNKSAITKSLRDMISSALGQGLWVAIFAVIVFLGHLIFLAIQK